MMKISLDKTIRAMSLALDLAEISSTENAEIVERISNINYSEHKFLHHSKRTTYIALELGHILLKSDESLKRLYISSLVHDIGAVNSLKKSHIWESYIMEHCDNGAAIISSFPIFNDLSYIILYHHENWDGSGPMKQREQEIPIESQIIRLADLLELLYDEDTPSYKQKSKLTNWVLENKGIIFSEDLVNAFLQISSRDIFWFNVETISYLDFILDSVTPKLNRFIDLQQFEAIAYIFASIIDSKSAFTARHSREIASLAYNVAKSIGYDNEKCSKIKIAGLLHDIGKLAIPRGILDKDGSLTPDEFSMIKSHPYYTKIILDKIEDIEDISEWASNHHEKLNGKGYPRSLGEAHISEEARILCVCDIYQALTEDRPYRKGLGNVQALAILDSMVSDGFICEKALKYLKNAL